MIGKKINCFDVVTNPYPSRDYEVLVRVQCHDAMITNEINLIGLARFEDECKTQTRFIEFVIIPS